jgi:hypothetical protein
VQGWEGGRLSSPVTFYFFQALVCGNFWIKHSPIRGIPARPGGVWGASDAGRRMDPIVGAFCWRVERGTGPEAEGKGSAVNGSGKRAGAEDGGGVFLVTAAQEGSIGQWLSSRSAIEILCCVRVLSQFYPG